MSIIHRSPVPGDADRPEGPQCSDKERQNQYGGSDETQGPVHHREHCQEGRGLKVGCFMLIEKLVLGVCRNYLLTI